MTERKMRKTKKAWSVEGFPVPNRVFTEFIMEIKPAPPQQGISKGYAAQLQKKKNLLCIFRGCAQWPCLLHGVLAAFLAV